MSIQENLALVTKFVEATAHIAEPESITVWPFRARARYFAASPEAAVMLRDANALLTGGHWEVRTSSFGNLTFANAFTLDERLEFTVICESNEATS